MVLRWQAPAWALMLATCALAQWPMRARADDPLATQTIAVLVTTAPGAPTADELVDYYSTLGKGPPPLQGLTVGNPQGVNYLLPIRATGDFLARLQAHPDSMRAKLERYVIVLYASGADLGAALAALRADPYVAAAYRTPESSFSSATLIGWDVGVDDPLDTPSQYWRTDLNLDAAWQVAGGHALISDLDSGLYPTHPALAQFSSAGSYVGGNFIPVDSADISLSGLVNPPQNCLDTTGACVDERRAMPVTDPLCNAHWQTNPLVQPAIAGHGTHVAGILAANGGVNSGVQGTCKHCGIAEWKIAYLFCDETVPQVSFLNNYNAQAAALTLSGDIGAQVANMSLGTSSSGYDIQYCHYNPNDPMCEALQYTAGVDVVMTAASGNERRQLNFPAWDGHTVATGGFQENLAFWDMSPGGNANCPPYPFSSECGSNYTTIYTPGLYGPPQELVGAAPNIRSTTYPGYNWNSALQCGDQFPGPGFGNGVGLCTGTSMSAPEIAGIFGILRSINPLVPGGSGPTVAGTLRKVLASTTYEAQGGAGWDPYFGYGRPDAAAAARKVIGKVAGATIRNRATPLFRLYSSAQHDYADVSTPQLAVALMLNQGSTWQPPTSLPVVPNYSSFPHNADEGTIASPRASVYVLTTEYTPRSAWPALVPLYLMDKLTGTTHDDFMLVTTKADIEYAHTHGYNLRTIQGYVYQPCSPEPGCIPPGAQKFYRACNTSLNDCATFLQNEASTFAAAGYTSTYPPATGTSTLLGYAYPATDTDSDGLPDGFEYVVGTDPTRTDSDGDGVPDATEFPMVGLPVSDPCAGGVGALHCAADVIFRSGFEGV